MISSLKAFLFQHFYMTYTYGIFSSTKRNPSLCIVIGEKNMYLGLDYFLFFRNNEVYSLLFITL